jgi:hypothetical protein
MMGHVTAMENSYMLVAKLAFLTTNECSRKIPYHGVHYLLILDTMKFFIFENVSLITKEFCYSSWRSKSVFYTKHTDECLLL